MKKIIIIGGGVAGLTCSIYLARFGYNVSIYNNYSLGCLSETQIVQNFPGFPNGINGFELLNNIQQQAEKQGVQIYENKVIQINDNKTIKLDNNEDINYDLLVIATGMTPKTLDIKDINSFNFIHYCATCDGPLYKNKTTAIIGGGDTALSEALYLADICEKVYLILRRDKFRGTQILVDKVKQKSNIKILYNSIITNIFDKPSNEIQINKQFLLKIDGLFISIGYNPNDELFKNKNIKDCYICGDCIENPYRQAIIAAGEGAKTAIEIHEKFN